MAKPKLSLSGAAARRNERIAQAEAKRQAGTQSLLPSGKPTTGLKVPKTTSKRDDSRDSIIASLEVGGNAMFSQEADLSKLSHSEITRTSLHDALQSPKAVFNSTIGKVMDRVGKRTGATYTRNLQVQFWDKPARLVFVITVTRLS